MTNLPEARDVAASEPGDPLAHVATDLDAISEVALAERAEVFARIHDELTKALGSTIDEQSR